MQKKYLPLISLVMVASLLSACTGGSLMQPTTPAINAMAESALSDATPRTLSVNGSGSAYLTPDIAYMNVGVHTEGKIASEVVDKNNQRSLNVAAALEGLGVEDKDIQTTNFSIYPQQQVDERGQATGEITYLVDNTVFVTVRDLAQLGELLDAVVEAGANSINGVQFDVSDRTAALSQARQAAVENASAIAELLADSADVTLGAIQSINMYGGVPTPFMGGMGGAMRTEVAVSVPVSPGQLMITVEVNIVYEIH